jgi:CspA family cold shock protein
MTTGTVKFFNAQQGYGFIQPDDGTSEVFFHVSAVEASVASALSEGGMVSFDVSLKQGSPQALSLRPV